jgi:hypothetical protein
VTWSVNYEEAWEFVRQLKPAIHFDNQTVNVLLWEVGSTNLLCDTSCLSGLNVGFSQFIKNECFSSVYMPKDAHNWASEFLLLADFSQLSLSNLFKVFFFPELHSLCFTLLIIFNSKDVDCLFFLFCLFDWLL